MDYFKQLAQDIITTIDNKSKIDRNIDLPDFYDYYSDIIEDYLDDLKEYSMLSEAEISTIFEYIDEIISSGEF